MHGSEANEREIREPGDGDAVVRMRGRNGENEGGYEPMAS